MRPSSITRRAVLHYFIRFAGILGASTMGALRPLMAATWNQAAFESMKVEVAIAAVGIVDAQNSEDIIVNAPEIAENGAQVPIDITSKIAGTERIFIFSDKNVQPYVADFHMSKGLEPFISTRIKMGETSPVRVYVLARGQYYVATREVKVTIGGCAS